jgi:nitronate monooxygenase
VRNHFFEEWNGREAQLKNTDAARDAYRAAQQSGDYDTAVIYAGEAVDLISGLPAAGELVEEIGKAAEQELFACHAF